MKKYITRKTCRLCNSKNIQLALPLNKSPLCDAYLTEPRKQKFYDLNVYLCNDCGFVQINTIVNPEVIYRDYIYVTTSSSGLQKHFDRYAADVCTSLEIEESNLTIDIGSNDGTLLSYFKKRNHRVLGIEPATKIAAAATESGIETLPDFFDTSLAEKVIKKYGHAELITINNLFANIDDLEEFTKALEIFLGQDGVIVIESSYLLDMIDNMVFDFIYHEHLSYFSILPLVRFFERFDIRLIHLQEVSTKGGSLRYYWAREGSKWKVNSSVNRLIERERQSDITIKTFEVFQKNIEDVKGKLNDSLDQFTGKKIVGYGASATSTTLISHFELHKHLSYLVDDNPAKIGTYSPGFHIPVYGFERLIKEEPDLIVILAWRFKEEILRKLQGINSVIVVPLPKVEGIKA